MTVAIITAQTMHPFLISLIGRSDICIVLSVAFLVDIQADVLVSHPERKIVIRNSVRPGKVMDDSLCVTDASMAYAWNKPSDAR